MGKKIWTDQMIADKIICAKEELGIDRMPSNNELKELYGSAALVNKITRTGGFYYWANKLGLEIKSSETLQGYTIENEIKKLLENIGFRCELTSVRHPYDILVDDCVKIDVKSAKRSKVVESDVFSFRLAKKQPTCDIYVAVCLDDKQAIEKIYVIPAHVMTGKTQLAIGVDQSKYDSFIDRWDIVRAYEMAFTEIQ